MGSLPRPPGRSRLLPRVLFCRMIVVWVLFWCFFAPGEGSGSLRPPGAAPSTEIPVGAVSGHFRDPPQAPSGSHASPPAS